jgi:hypothetical protein
MLMGKVHNLCRFGFGHFIRVDAAFANAVLMHTHHYPMCSFVILMEEALKDMDNEVHRRVIVVEQQNAIKARPLRLRLRPGDAQLVGRKECVRVSRQGLRSSWKTRYAR